MIIDNNTSHVNTESKRTMTLPSEYKCLNWTWREPYCLLQAADETACWVAACRTGVLGVTFGLKTWSLTVLNTKYVVLPYYYIWSASCATMQLQNHAAAIYWTRFPSTGRILSIQVLSHFWNFDSNIQLLLTFSGYKYYIFYWYLLINDYIS